MFLRNVLLGIAKRETSHRRGDFLMQGARSFEGMRTGTKDFLAKVLGVREALQDVVFQGQYAFCQLLCLGVEFAERLP